MFNEDLHWNVSSGRCDVTQTMWHRGGKIILKRVNESWHPIRAQLGANVLVIVTKHSRRTLFFFWCLVCFSLLSLADGFAAVGGSCVRPGIHEFVSTLWSTSGSNRDVEDLIQTFESCRQLLLFFCQIRWAHKPGWVYRHSSVLTSAHETRESDVEYEKHHADLRVLHCSLCISTWMFTARVTLQRCLQLMGGAKVRVIIWVQLWRSSAVFSCYKNDFLSLHSSTKITFMQTFSFFFKRDALLIYSFWLCLELMAQVWCEEEVGHQGADEDVEWEVLERCRDVEGRRSPVRAGWEPNIWRDQRQRWAREKWGTACRGGGGREIPLCGGSSHFLFVCQLYFPPSCCTQEVCMTIQLWSAVCASLRDLRSSSCFVTSLVGSSSSTFAPENKRVSRQMRCP